MGATRGTVLIVACSGRTLATSAARAGVRCIVADHYGDLDLDSLAWRRTSPRASGGRCRARALVDAADGIASDAVVYGASLENHPELIARLASERELLGNAPDVLRHVRDPHRLATVMAAVGVATPRTLAAGSEAAADPGRRWLRKRRASGGGVGIRAWRAGLRLRRGEFVQEYVPGVPGSAAFVTDGVRSHLVGLARQWIGDATLGAAGFRYCGGLIPFSEDERELRLVATQIRRAAAALVSACDLRGVFGIDFVLREETVYVIEVNPRYTASMELLERAHGLALFEWHVAGCRATLPEITAPPLSAGAACGKAILFARRRCTLADTRPWLAEGVRDVPRPNTTIPPRAPVCTLFAEAPTLEACEQALRRQATEWRERLEPARERRHAS